MLELVEAFLKAGILDGLTHSTPESGAPQGAVLSPLLSNLYLDPLDHLVAQAGYEMVRYADDFVTLCRTREQADRALALVQTWTTENGLTLHPTKTRIAEAVTDGFEFLGYRFVKHRRLSILLQVKLSTGKPDAGNPPVRFGGRGGRIQSAFPTPIMQITIAESDADIAACYIVMRELRPHIGAEQFLSRVRRQEAAGFRLAMMRDAGGPVAVAGFRILENLAWGRFLYVDDLVTLAACRSQGCGAKLLAWLRERAAQENCAQLHLDSGIQRKDAHRFYEREGMTMSSFHFIANIARNQPLGAR
ncbi:MAG: GNAT family N-acetyltransferase [Pirellulales bacterium]